MQSIHQIAEEIIAREGGYVNDPDDPGGATKYGVTLGTLRRIGFDKTGDGRVNAADVRALSRRDARRIFLKHYFETPGLAALPPVLQPPVFDMYVNAGANAVKILQRLLVRMGQRLAVDGIIGPQTISAAEIAAATAADYLADAYGIARRNYYYRLGDLRPASRKFARRRDGGKGGWIRRAENFISERYHLTGAEHAARVAAWEG